MIGIVISKGRIVNHENSGTEVDGLGVDTGTIISAWLING